MNNYVETNTLSEHIIAFLGSARSTRAYFRILREQRIKRYKSASVKTTLYHLRQHGMITQDEDGWKLTEKGRSYKRPERLLEYLPSPFEKDVQKHTIVSFDIPESKRHARRWLRDQLRIFGYEMLQRSLWRGPGPLPKTFMERLKKLAIADCIKTFTVVGSKSRRQSN